MATSSSNTSKFVTFTDEDNHTWTYEVNPKGTGTEVSIRDTGFGLHHKYTRTYDANGEFTGQTIQNGYFGDSPVPENVGVTGSKNTTPNKLFQKASEAINATRTAEEAATNTQPATEPPPAAAVITPPSEQKKGTSPDLAAHLQSKNDGRKHGKPRHSLRSHDHGPYADPAANERSRHQAELRKERRHYGEDFRNKIPGFESGPPPF